MNPTQSDTYGAAISALRSRKIEGLPLFAPILESLQIRQTVNRLVPSEADIDLGRVVLVLLACLQAKKPVEAIGHLARGSGRQR